MKIETYKPPHVTAIKALQWLGIKELKILKSDMADNLVYKLKNIPKITQSKDKGELWIYRKLYEIEMKEIMEYYSKLGRQIDSAIYAIETPEEFNTSLSEGDIERAREYPIGDLIDAPVNGGMTMCPFHSEKTASMSIKKYNRYHCFGCGEKGDVIDFYMKIRGVSFRAAVTELSTN